MAWYASASPWGKLHYEIINHTLTKMFFADTETTLNGYPDFEIELAKYIETRIPLRFPISFENGTPFQKEVWHALLAIPLGETWSYQQLAQFIGRPKAVRAVGQACKRNPIGLVIPCHRVIGKNGAMTGYSGPKYVDLKAQILRFEQKK